MTDQLPPAVDPFDPPLAEITAQDFPEPRKPRKLIGLVAALGAVLCAGAVVLLVQLWPSGGATPAPTPAATAWAELPALPGTAEQTLRATDGGPQTRVEFVNETAQNVTIAWLGYDGERSVYATLAAGEKYTQDTFVGHVWIAAGPGGDALAVFQPTAQPARAVIRPAG
ncbi:hypothetical protein [Actinoplanes sp. L3-i22]|uniref:VHL beta domain-containing protein n=1 Tax=Actinoplanes sp. L3-i22 TaxID=2836373 RepID=UPI001C85FC52|nr:hypothetical protein [Actinoplanes sp. L3-i22]